MTHKWSFKNARRVRTSELCSPTANDLYSVLNRLIHPSVPVFILLYRLKVGKGAGVKSTWTCNKGKINFLHSYLIMILVMMMKFLHKRYLEFWGFLFFMDWNCDFIEVRNYIPLPVRKLLPIPINKYFAIKSFREMSGSTERKSSLSEPITQPQCQRR